MRPRAPQRQLIAEIKMWNAGDKMPDILFVDDEQHILNSLQRVFRGFENYTCHFADSPMKALEVLASTSITVLISDHKMPQMAGAEFLSRVREKRPDTIRILLTGQADLEAVQKAVNSGQVFRFFLKPWKDDDLRSAVKQAVEFHDLTLENRRLMALTQEQNDRLNDTVATLDDQVQTRTVQLADALYTARSLNEKLSQGLYTSTKALFHMIRLARPELGSHSRRVADHCAAVGPLLGFNENQTQDLEIAGLLHDGGKLGLPSCIIDKHISDYRKEEHELYQTHCFIGTEYLKNVPQYENISKFIMTHHERYDGSGFPSGLERSQIPIEGYLIGLLDEFDHFMDRPRNDPEYNYQYACQVIAEYTDKKYPQRVVQVVLDYAPKVVDKLKVDGELLLGLSELSPNLELIRDIYTMSGSLLLAAGVTLTPATIARLRSIARLDPITGKVHVRRKERRPADAVIR